MNKIAVKRDWILCGTPILRSMQRAYCKHRYHAQDRKISFLLSFDEWREIWDASGYWFARGVHYGQFVMGRHKDRGFYEMGNVEIVLGAQNSADAQMARWERATVDEKLTHGIKMRHAKTLNM